MECASSCSCRLGRIVRALGVGSRPSPKKRQWQFVGSAILFFFAFVFYVAITRNVDHHSVLSLAVFSFFGIATFLAALLSVIVGAVGCDDCVSRM
jgi:CDP-diglyceride synthetase